LHCTSPSWILLIGCTSLCWFLSFDCVYLLVDSYVWFSLIGFVLVSLDMIGGWINLVWFSSLRWFCFPVGSKLGWFIFRVNL
jgi:hypothetical protein